MVYARYLNVNHRLGSGFLITITNKFYTLMYVVF
jgi:hypothetical protein